MQKQRLACRYLPQHNDQSVIARFQAACRVDPITATTHPAPAADPVEGVRRANSTTTEILHSSQDPRVMGPGDGGTMKLPIRCGLDAATCGTGVDLAHNGQPSIYVWSGP